MTDLKDVLHFYLGCKVQYKDANILILKSVSLLSTRLGSSDDDVHFNVPIQNFKLILRRLSDMTEEEVMECFMHGANWREHGNQAILTANEFRWLLGKGFDLFKLIDSNQAIDAKTLQL